MEPALLVGLVLGLTIPFGLALVFRLWIFLRNRERALQSEDIETWSKLRSSQARTSLQTRNQVEKEINLSSKQILGLDNATYLAGLPLDPSTLNVAPAYFKPQYDKILGSKSSCFTPAQGAAKLANGCVNPWDVEHEPNSTIFPHLRETAIAGPSRSVEPDQMANCVPLAVGKGSNTRDSELVSPVAGLRPFWQPEWIHSCIGSTADIEMSEFPGSEATLPSSSSTATGDTSRVNSPVTGDTSRVDSPVTSTSSVSLAKEGKGIKIRPGSPVDIVNYAVVTPHDSKIESAASAEFAFPHDIMAASPQGVPPIRQTLLCNVASHVCEKCDLSFRTRGQLNQKPRQPQA
ncbi:hypothetical protein HBI38_105230 [Parastagonospora nodorum]|nr:hypothetical protein HBH45_061620 [Parastagonospora nodorum]KAH4161675.1 hypothetical protein HBH44_095210 [Parastagonospora nodorum]KAH4648784.1 hypothetical protein HBH81_003990 [Parastagonospora nodorum]KAH4942456.1 hypothetical protein HBI79_026050 [Parastagonospora nodorum]KAH5107620.1 hypothetical protein HBH72_042820 [Parastagonospora nodorum]